MRREEARNNFQIKGRRYIFLKNVDHLTQEEKEALSRLEAQNLDTIQAMQIRMNLQQLFTMDARPPDASSIAGTPGFRSAISAR